MKFPTLLICVPIHIVMFAMPIRILLFSIYGCNLLFIPLSTLFLALVLLSLIGVQLNIESLLSYLTYDFDIEKLQLPTYMAKYPFKLLHHSSLLFQRDTNLNGLFFEFSGILLQSLSLLLSDVLLFHELLIFIASGIEL